MAEHSKLKTTTTPGSPYLAPDKYWDGLVKLSLIHSYDDIAFGNLYHPVWLTDVGKLYARQSFNTINDAHTEFRIWDGSSASSPALNQRSFLKPTYDHLIAFDVTVSHNGSERPFDSNVNNFVIVQQLWQRDGTPPPVALHIMKVAGTPWWVLKVESTSTSFVNLCPVTMGWGYRLEFFVRPRTNDDGITVATIRLKSTGQILNEVVVNGANMYSGAGATNGLLPKFGLYTSSKIRNRLFQGWNSATYGDGTIPPPVGSTEEPLTTTFDNITIDTWR